MAASLAGAESVLMSDNDPLAVEVATMNVERNSYILQGTNVEHRILDWSVPELWPRDYDIVIAADVLYEPSFADDIASLLSLVLKKGGHLLLADPFIRPHREYFLDSLRSQGKWKYIRKTHVSRESQNIVFVTAVLG
uniref:Calmodulin-lysine N-methyltransferase n=1 Tax=Rhodosorus marinus TaxID=101924 RepID=A0A7S2ZQZ2_9RHOD|mmetsp:Transcript_29210/g.113357  ORF Transcript_29210/g.113357 Transcript_29210/m.113357 type:complete len:137 (+) Transcript_29210:420-830(+)